MRRSLFSPLALALGLASSAWAEAEADWQAVVALDAGPQKQFRSREEARAGAGVHLDEQERALRAFLKAYPADAHAFEAQLRLARLLQIRAGFQNSEPARAEARRILDELNRSTSGAQRREVDFARIAFSMRTMKPTNRAEREQLLATARRFQAEYADDHRLPALFAEIATLYDREPEAKRSLLLDAQRLTSDDGLRLRIADDLKRLDLLGKPLDLQVTTRGGKPVDVKGFRGQAVLVVFFAEWSPPSVEAVATIQRFLPGWPKDQVQVLGVSLDNDSAALGTLLGQHGVAWPVGFDGKGWDSPVVRAFGINTLPTVWLLDRAGVLRSLNALEAINDQVRDLLRGK